MAATRSAGRVSIRVLPDSTGFRQDVKRMLDRLERQLRVRVPVELVVDRATLAKLKREIESLVIKLKPQIDLSVDQAEITKLKERIERIKPVVNVELNTKAAATAMAILSRTREALIRVRLDGPSLSSVTTRLAALAGGNVLLDTINEGREFLDNIDRQAVSLGKLALMMGTVANAAVSMAGGLITAGAQLNDVVGFLALAPAFGIGAAIQIASLVAIFKDWGKEMEFLNPYLSELQDILSMQFFNELRPAMKDLVENLFPALRDTLDRLGMEMGIFGAKMAEAIQKFVTPAKFTTMMDRMTRGIRETQGAISPLIEAITILGMVGSEYFERFGRAITKAAESFRDFIKAADERGDINRWIEDAIQLTKDLTSFTINLARVMGTLATATEAAGFGNIGDWAASLDRAADVMARPEFQKPLVTFLTGFREGLQETMRGIQELGPGLSSIAPTMREVFRGIGTSVRVVLGYISEFMQNPFFQKGLTDFIDGVERGLRNLGPAIEPMATGLGGILTLLGTVAGELGNLIATFTIEFGPGLDRIGQELDGLVEPLSSALRDIISNLAPPFEYFATQVVPPLVNLFKTEFLPILVEISEYVAAGLQPVLEELKSFIEGDLKTALTGIGDWLAEGDPKEFGKAVTDFFNEVETFMQKLRTGEGMEGDWLGLESGSADEGMGNFLTDLTNFNNDVAAALRDGWNTIVLPAWDELIADQKAKAEEFTKNPDIPGEALLNWFIGLLAPIGEQIAKDWEQIKTDWNTHWAEFGAGLTGMGEDFRGWLEGLFTPMQEWWDRFFDSLFGTEGNANVKMLSFPALAAASLMGLTESITVGLPIIQAAWDTFWANFGLTFSTIWEGFKLTVSTKMTEIGVGIATAGLIVQENWNLFWTGVGLFLATKWEEFKLTVSTKMTEMGLSLTTAGLTIQENWNTFWTAVGLVLSTKWEEFKLTVATKYLELQTGLATKGEEIKTTWDTGWAAIGTILSTKWEEFKVTAATKYAEIQSGMQTKGSEIKTTWDTGWALIATTLSTKWEEMKTTVSTKFSEIVTSVATKGIEAKNSLESSWETARSITASKWEEIRSTLTSKLTEAASNVIAKGEEIKSNIESAWTQLNVTTTMLWGILVATISNKITEAVEWVAGLPGRAVAALSGADLSGSGRAIIQTFIDGMGSMAEAAGSKAAEILMKVRSFFPSSPAKRGPFSGAGWRKLGNGSVVDQFADGMAAKISKVAKVSNDLAKAAAIDPEALDMNFEQALEGGGPGDHKSTVINTYYPVAEPTSRTVEKAASLTRMKGGL